MTDNLKLGTVSSEQSTRLMLLGSGELGREVAIEAMRLGLEVIAVDRYPGAPAMQVAHRSSVIDMQNEVELRELILKEKPQFIVPEIEAIATSVLKKMERDGFNICPSGSAVNLTMNREGIRDLASKNLSIPTSKYLFATNAKDCKLAISAIGFPCIVKPVMSSSGKGQIFVTSESEAIDAWERSISAGRGKEQKVIVEEFIDFDFEITLLTVAHVGGIFCCPPIGHSQVNGDYRESWQPQPMSIDALKKSTEIATLITKSLGGLGVFGVELFIKGDQVWFSEVSPRPHDTGMVTMVSQELSQFSLHVRAMLGVDLSNVSLGKKIGASAAIVAFGNGKNIVYKGLQEALSLQNSEIRLFSKPEVNVSRRLGVALTTANHLEEAKKHARLIASKILVEIS